MRAVLLYFFSLSLCQAQIFRVANTYQSNMVLQQSPKRAKIWGFGQIGAVVTVTMDQFTDTLNVGGNAIWSFTLPPQPSGGPRSISIEHNVPQGARSTVLLENIVFGDVWLCAGEGNMQFPMRNIFNSTLEIENAVKYSEKIRTAQLESRTSDSELDEQYPYRTIWSKLETASVADFSAVCLLYAIRLLDEVPDHAPIGLIQATYEHSNIEAWVSKRVINVCNSTFSPEYGQGLLKEHSIWNAMIHPLTKNSLKGVIWYQGESNVNYNLPYYTCHFKNLTFDWSYTFFDGTVPTHTDGWAFPFGFVQLGPMESEIEQFDQLISHLRLHQTFDTEVAPNNYNNETFMAPAYDLYDGTSPYGSIYYRDKQTVAKRLANSFVFLYYDRFDLEFVGPIPSIYKLDTFCTATFGWKVKFNGQAGDPSGFFFKRRNGIWIEAPIFNITSDTMTFEVEELATELAYGWSARQCEYKMCPIYSIDRGPDGLPAIIMSFSLYTYP
ncbi:sialate O-acetylesterase-like isoform X2 [Neocloeon triangulifer]|uniref:sialate O-acetylesterase-like isoform X2 n=1 Tax=Neocloeon triangulifer TaxID=2078957 RepID=UPI00286F99E2|nr:sialate O-acetylesterase-like isoform X2 [Neocloeon triangulifer]